ncbi:MAG TPA: hypothetical protein VF363_07370 [Candidatus Eisenbacteria bacterium]
MRPRMPWFTLGSIPVLVAAALLTPGPARAAGEFGVAFLTGFNTYAQSDLNDELVAPINVLLSGTGYKMDDVSNGIGFGGGLRWRSTTSPITVAVDYERLNGNSKLSVPGGEFEVKAPANAFTATVYYFFPSASRARFGFGAGGGLYSSAGSLRTYDSTTLQEETEDMKGTGVGFHGVGAADVTLSSVSHLDVSVGYRYAKTTDVKVAGTKVQNSDGSDSKLDWSGLVTRVGLSFYFGAK